MTRRPTGFTLIELMVVIVIIGILVAIALPNFMGATDRAKAASTKANMHTVQTMLETYAVDWGGLYPATYTLFLDDAGSNNYAKLLRNPVDGTTASAAVAAGVAITGASTGLTKGAVYYEFLSSNRYYLYGADSLGKAIKAQGGVFVLTNN